MAKARRKINVKGRENPWFFLKNTFLRRTLVHKKGVAFLTAQMGTLTEQGQKCYILNRTYVLIWQNKGKCLEQMEMIHEKAGKQEQSAEAEITYRKAKKIFLPLVGVFFGNNLVGNEAGH